MKRTLSLFLGAAALSLAGAASAQQWPWPFGQPQQPPYGQPYGQPYGDDRSTITFYEYPNFGGRSVTVYGEENNFLEIGFNDRARSARANGSFLVCEDVDFRGRCERVSGDVRDLGYVGLAGRVSSARMEGGGRGYDRDEDPRSGPGYGYGSARREGVEGRTAVFFPTPRVNNSPVAARGQGSADQFCRAAGYGMAIYYSQGERTRNAVDQDGRIVDAPVLRDVLCRR